MKGSLLVNMVPAVDYDKSIKRERLTYKLTFGVVFDFFITYFMSLFLIVIIALFIPMMINGVNNMFFLIVGIIFCFVVECWMIGSLILMNGLVVFNGKNMENNQKNMLALLNEYYDDTYASDVNEKVIRKIKLSAAFGWGRSITVLLDNERVLLNITTLGRGDGMSPLHGLSNYLKCKRLAKAFNEQY